MENHPGKRFENCLYVSGTTIRLHRPDISLDCGTQTRAHLCKCFNFSIDIFFDVESVFMFAVIFTCAFLPALVNRLVPF